MQEEIPHRRATIRSNPSPKRGLDSTRAQAWDGGTSIAVVLTTRADESNETHLPLRPGSIDLAQVERCLTAPLAGRVHPAIGPDIKVMGVRTGSRIAWATAGKNPINHVGKTHADELHAQVEDRVRSHLGSLASVRDEIEEIRLTTRNHNARSRRQTRDAHVTASSSMESSVSL